ncbi:MAG: glutamyl-tRNA reductase [Gammaproteobacteria bacterium]|uniref:glutamyl-tRNA reductase n=1 Tax=Pseudomaricurvus alcaniphilus TaxID=1166482 RepID=UPI00140D7202|nr:glutamyl-tRNA reductase [Pseudomaricurvus alcaniphilus]MBR9911841.1 glutamyl-tRNA reductase [Gammaproteobacteria bacterium]NHN39270.1 glutamyl-tRNA reductase [Pseudomaricurvus alcaniphilus]
MTLLAFGINHNTAPLDIRERIAFVPEQVHEALAQVCGQLNIDEVAILSTCNRTELYAHLKASREVAAEAVERIQHWLETYHRVECAGLDNCHYWHVDEDAIGHMMQVASGLDSLVLGEPQILGQMKSAYAVACEAGTVGRYLHSAFHKVFATAKRVRTETAIGENPVSVAYAAVTLAQQIFSDLKQDTALLVGAGETIDLVAQHLTRQGLGRLIVANRTLERAAQLAQKYSAEAVLLADIPDLLHRADIVITSTASQLPLLGKGAVESALKKRRHKPMFMVDIAVPRDIEPEVGTLDDVYLYSVDDLREVIDENRRSRESAAAKALLIVQEGVQQFMAEVRSLDSVATIKAYRHKAEELRDRELGKALKLLESGVAPEQVLTQLARGLTNKLLHSPTTQLKKAGLDGDSQLIDLTQQLFDLSKPDIEKHEA